MKTIATEVDTLPPPSTWTIDEGRWSERALSHDDVSLQLTLAIPPWPRAAAVARRSLSELAIHLDRSVLDNVELMVSELVTNCVRHAGLDRDQSITVSVRLDKEAIRVEVSNPGEGFVVPRSGPRDDQPTGRGLRLVDRLASRWGVISNNHTTVWFEIDC